MAQMDSYCRKAPSSGGRRRGCCAEYSERPRGGGKACVVQSAQSAAWAEMKAVNRTSTAAMLAEHG